MVITGKIFDIVIINDKVAQIVLRKKMNDKIVPVAISIFGYWKQKAIEEMKIKMKDKIRGNVYMKSKIFNGKYYTDVYFKEIYFADTMSDEPIGMFKNEDGYLVDTDSGEIIDD